MSVIMHKGVVYGDSSQDEISKLLEWKLVGSAVGLKAIPLPEKLNEICVEVSYSTTSFVFNIPYAMMTDNQKYIRGGEFITLSMTREEVEEINVSYELDRQTKIGYVRISQFKDNTFSQFKSAIDYLEENGAVGIVFDLRGNPGGYLHSVTDVISYLIPNGNTVVSYQYKGKSTTVYTTKNDSFNHDHVVNLPFVVICNERAASAGEIFTAALRDYNAQRLLRATIVGTTTYKKGIMQSTYYYADKSSITMTVAYYNPPSGINYHGIGVTPDVVVEDADSQTDLQLEAAYSEMHKLLNAN